MLINDHKNVKNYKKKSFLKCKFKFEIKKLKFISYEIN